MIPQPPWKNARVPRALGEILLFALAGFCGRAILRPVESRWQMVFWLATAFSLQRRRSPEGFRKTVRPAILNGAAAALGVFTAKAYFEPHLVEAAAASLWTLLT